MSTYIDTSSSNVPAFLSKLWMLVEEESTDELICWDPVSMMTFLTLNTSEARKFRTVLYQLDKSRHLKNVDPGRSVIVFFRLYRR